LVPLIASHQSGNGRPLKRQSELAAVWAEPAQDCACDWPDRSCGRAGGWRRPVTAVDVELAQSGFGIQIDHVLIARLSALSGDKYDTAEKMANFYEVLLDKLAGVPQVRNAGFVSSPPPAFAKSVHPFLVQGRSDMSPNHPPQRNM